MAIAPTLIAGAPYIAAALELARWSLEFVQRAQAGEMTESEMAAEWEANVRVDVRQANALWQASKDGQGAR